MEYRIGVVGLGYVGLPLAVEFGKKFPTKGIDINEKRVSELRQGIDRTLETEKSEILAAKNLEFTTNIQDAKDCNIYIVTVPTPIDSRNDPDLRPLEGASKAVGTVLSKGDIVIYESTVYPGVTEEFCVPFLEKVSGLKFNKDFFCGYSPERINPGDKERTLTKIRKITSGSTPEIAEIVDHLYNTIVTAGTFKASSLKVAEAAKVIENVQRDVNIALVNELAMIFDTMGIATRDVIEAAGTKWNFIKLFPGLVGGHCIGVDPYYLTFKSVENGYTPDLILTARLINNGVPKMVAEKTIKGIIRADKKVKGAKVLILGMTFKENCTDLRNTKVVDIYKELEDIGCLPEIWDPWVNAHEAFEEYGVKPVESPLGSPKKYAAIIAAVAHDQFKGLTQKQYVELSEGEPVLIDVKGIIPKPTWRL